MVGTAATVGQGTSPREGRRLRQAAAAEYVGYSESTLEKKRLTGDGPPYIKLSGRVVYDTRDLDLWLAERRVTSTSQRPTVTGSPRSLERRRSNGRSRQQYRNAVRHSG
jgi:predicted DNA-binding transcriptional regulator AlpA